MNLYALQKAAAINALEAIDPDWRDHFGADWQRAGEHYKLFRFREVGAGHPFEPPELIREAYEDCDCDDPFCESHDDGEQNGAQNS